MTTKHKTAASGKKPAHAEKKPAKSAAVRKPAVAAKDKEPQRKTAAAKKTPATPAAAKRKPAVTAAQPKTPAAPKAAAQKAKPAKVAVLDGAPASETRTA